MTERQKMIEGSNTIKRKIMCVSDFDSQTQTYTMSAYCSIWEAE